MSILPWIPAYLAIGAVVGFFAGMLGIGGGLIMVPLLTMIFAAQGCFPPNQVLHLALGTSMAAIIFTSFASLKTHHQHGAVLWRVVAWITPGILLGTMAGTLLASQISSRALSFFFTGFVCMVAVQMAMNFKPKPTRTLPAMPWIVTMGVFIGTLSSLVGIGGGSLTVPFLAWCNIRVQNAIGTSAAVGLPIAIGGTAGYIFNGLGYDGFPSGSLGFVYLPAVAGLVMSSMITAPFGARSAHRLPVKTLKRIFSAALVLLALKMFWELASTT